MLAAGSAWQASPEGLRIAMRLTPRGGKDALGKVEVLSDGRPVLAARVRAAPTDGEANQALIRLIAKTLKVSASQVSIAQGATSRVKMVLVAGDGEKLCAALEGLTR
ncbi:UPF0235 protein [Labrys miyagiensis]|uniref:UPF0235 protein GCM10007874_48500 n=1 Tax=Labrys miyagiensis TaxID=346912 RepID=A0ABQ6CPW6_9HYPH|nr:DUF167 family protein [Labrys miyagiensis]GLS21833.1 UPF0235 protein [Labrys miyagiensis]